MRAEPQTLDQLPTPSLVVERSLFEANVAAAASAARCRWGAQLRASIASTPTITAA